MIMKINDVNDNVNAKYNDSSNNKNTNTNKIKAIGNDADTANHFAILRSRMQ